MFISAEQAFKQCVLFGVKRRPGTPQAALVNRLVAFGEGQDQVELPEHWAGDPYLVPAPKAAWMSGWCMINCGRPLRWPSQKTHHWRLMPLIVGYPLSSAINAPSLRVGLIA